MTDRLPGDATGARHGAALLEAGRLVAMPTETVYGLAARFDDAAAVRGVFSAKDRPAEDPLIVHVSPGLVGEDRLDGLQALGVVGSLSNPQAETSRQLMTHAWPGPLTLVLPRGPRVLDTVTAGLPEVAVRMPRHPDALALLDATGHPLVAPSANRFGRLSPTTADAVLAELDGRIDAVLDGGPCPVGVESTVLRIRADGGTDRLRPGAITDDAVAGWLGAAPSPIHGSGPSPSPGTLTSHYAPHTPLVVGGAGDVPDAVRRLAVLGWSDPSPLAEAFVARPPFLLRPRRVLSSAALAPDGDPRTAAHRLFAALRTLDGSGAELILVEPVPEGGGLLDALRDRLARAAAR